MKKTLVTLVTLLGLSTTVKAGWGADDSAAPIVNRQQVKEALDNHSAVLVEALAPKYFKRSRLPGSLNIPMSNAEALIPKLLPDKNAKIIVYCLSRA